MEPMEKRARLSHDQETCTQSSDPVPEHPTAVLADEFTEQVKFVKAVSCPILQKKETSRLMKELLTNLPLTDLLHLKRVKPGETKETPLQILVFPLSTLCESPEDVTDVSADAVFAHLSKNGVSSEGLGEPQVVSVCARQPATRLQFNTARQHWPSNFHENKEISRKINKCQFDDKALRDHGRYMRQAIEQARKAGTGGEAVGAVVVDPASGTVLAAGHDRRYLHPLQHATMVTVDLVAKAQGGGAWQLQDPSMYSGQVELRADGTGPYLCTGYDLYITREPCTMCAMALVHSRIRTVFYSSAAPCGALGTVYQVHTEQGLNHHYDVYRGLLQQECELLLNKTQISNEQCKDKPVAGDTDSLMKDTTDSESQS